MHTTSVILIPSPRGGDVLVILQMRKQSLGGDAKCPMTKLRRRLKNQLLAEAYTTL